MGMTHLKTEIFIFTGHFLAMCRSPQPNAGTLPQIRL